MGWKNVKEHYKIKHLVAIHEEWERKITGCRRLCIGTGYVHDLIEINVDKKTFKPGKLGLSGNKDLQRYWAEITADPDKLWELFEAPDTFERSIPVYTYKDGKIIECQCEELGWPNVTHDGQMMYENLFFADRNDAIERAIANAEARVENDKSWLNDTKEKLAKAEKSLQQAQEQLIAYARLKSEAMSASSK